MTLRNLILFYISFISFHLSAQIQVDWLEIIEERSGNNTALYAINTGHCPLTISMGFEKLENLKADANLPVELIIPNDNKQHLVVTLSLMDDKKDSNYSFDFKYALGNTLSTVHDKDYPYTLPFQKGMTSVLGQGYNGRFSHHHIKALDFSVPVGTEVLAARDGVVIAVKKDSDKGCKKPSCINLSNYILIYHKDGTFGSYIHLKKNGANVREGDKVKAGELIGYSGNTGWSSGPHLHFEVYLPEFNRRSTVETKFKIDTGEVIYLEEKKAYTSK